GIYDVRLTVQGADETAFDEKRIILDSNLKIGGLTFSETDASFRVGGLPFSIIRSYNSFDANAGKGGDFGFGWSSALTDMQIEIDEEREEVPDGDTADESFSRRSGGGRDVTLTLP